MTLIISKGSGYEARRRLVRLQKDLINQAWKNKENENRAKNNVRDFQDATSASKVFTNSTRGLVHRATFVKGKGGEVIEDKQPWKE